MKRPLSFLILSILLLNSSYSLLLAHHANEKYCFDCMHKYKIGGKKNDTYEIKFDLKTKIFVNNRDSIGRIQPNDLSKLVAE